MDNSKFAGRAFALVGLFQPRQSPRKNSKLRTTNYELIRQGFTLVELIIVVSILGILAAIIMPEFSGHIQQSKEAAAKDTLRILREAIERYANDHNGVPPGYPSDDPSASPGVHAFDTQFFNGTYLSERPTNPFNSLKSIKLVDNNAAFPTEPESTTLFGWIYQPSTKTIKLNWSGTDMKSTAYWDY